MSTLFTHFYTFFSKYYKCSNYLALWGQFIYLSYKARLMIFMIDYIGYFENEHIGANFDSSN